ncbi:TetR family transcriptional regulator [Streptomyces venetus]|uniref:TetR family transcriptional regulator n=1 Tax=Streptomyces venetus TaxID=1701086 RepID=A0ABP8G0C3_9ACTN
MSSTTPTPPQASLTERRKAETRMEIARAAAGLFVRHGLRATRAEDIAQAAGIAPRTFYRYFATKEEAVAPLYAVGAQRWVEAVRAAPADASVLQALEQGVRHTLTPGAGVSASSWEYVRTLLRLAEANPSLRRVWAEVCQASERSLAEVLAARLAAGPEGDRLRTDPDNVAVPSHLRFAAAVASAAVRVAMEDWAAAGDAPADGGDAPAEGGDAPADGLEGAAGPGGAETPAETASRNLRVLRDFPWDGRRLDEGCRRR